VGIVHGIHEDTRQRARTEMVMPCDCEECVSTAIKLSGWSGS
jgi:hypothetical protein